jgi:hypothetical protein
MSKADVPSVVMFTGYGRTGKDHAGAVAQSLGFTLTKTAEGLKKSVWELDPIVGFTAAGGTVSPVRYKQVVPSPLSDAYKSGPYADEIRGLLQRMGTEVPDAVLGSDVWAKAVAERTRYLTSIGDSVVITDGRRCFELDASRAAGAVLVRVTRPGVGPANSHVNEIEGDVFPYDIHIVNSGTIGQYEAVVRDLILSLPNRRPGRFTATSGSSLMIDCATGDRFTTSWKIACQLAKGVSRSTLPSSSRLRLAA